MIVAAQPCKYMVNGVIYVSKNYVSTWNKKERKKGRKKQRLIDSLIMGRYAFMDLCLGLQNKK